MIEPNEIVMLFIGIGVLLFIQFNYRQIKRLPSYPVILAAFYVSMLGWTATVVEGFFWLNIFNYIEHASYLVSAILMVIWCWKISVKSRSKT